MPSKKRITDISLSEQFWEDYNRIENRQVRRALDKYIVMISKHGECPPGFDDHKAEGTSYKIGRLTMGNQGWRVLYYVNGSEMLWDRVVDHDEMARILRELAK